jgi:aldose 1-epimerase
MERSRPTIESSSFGLTSGGEPVDQYTLRNGCGHEATIMTYGATVTSLKVPDRVGNVADVVLGYSSLAEYEANRGYYVAIVGRFGNRIGEGRFTLDGKEYQLATNNGPNHLHGGMRGFDKAVWRASGGAREDRAFLELDHTSPDGDEGYPGRLDVKVTYSLTQGGALEITYTAAAHARTILNLTNHSYFNLGGDTSGDVFGHEITIAASHFTPTDETLIPTGELRPVEKTPFDFRQQACIGDRIRQDYEALAIGKGFDHNFVLDKTDEDLSVAAVVVEPTTRRVMEVSTTQPGVQFYTGNYIDGVTGRSGQPYVRHAGFCLETQHFPDSPNKPHFPSVVLAPDEIYDHTTVYRFSNL